MFVATVVLMVVGLTIVVAVVAYVAGQRNERQAWNDHLGLPERTPKRPYFSTRDFGTRRYIDIE